MTGRSRGEFELIAELAELLDRPTEGIGIGDDAATWTPTPGRIAVATTDILVEGIHFRLDWIAPRDLGWKALAVNLSDLAAMGATPRRALVSVALLADQGPLVADVYRGMAELARATGTFIVGGDTVRTSGPLVVNVALYGDADPARVLRRSAARPGDLLVVTGRLGASGAGLDLLLAEAAAAGSDTTARARLVAAHHRPRPRLAAGAALAALGVACAIDVSDGLASEAAHIATASGVAIEVDLDNVPLDADAVALLGEERARSLALTGGEDYELLATLSPELLADAGTAVAPETTLTVVGRVLRADETGSVTFMSGGRAVEPGKGYVAF